MDLKRQAQGRLWLWLPEKLVRITMDGGEDLPFTVVGEGVVQVPLPFSGRAVVEVG